MFVYLYLLTLPFIYTHMYATALRALVAHGRNRWSAGTLTAIVNTAYCYTA